MLDKSDALSTDLWSLVFLHMYPNRWRAQGGALSREDLQQYSSLHTLKLVCKKFRHVFHEHHDLFQVLVLRENIRKRALRGLLAWVLRHNTDITLLHSLCGGLYTEAALKYLIGKGKLRVAHLKSPSNSTIQMLSMCTSLAICTLCDPLQSVNLDCLKSMHTLVDLKLSSGTFAHVRLPSHLTSITLIKAQVEVDAIDAACGLHQLYIDRSNIYGLDSSVCMLTCLRKLWCCRSAVHTPQAACKLSTCSIVR